MPTATSAAPSRSGTRVTVRSRESGTIAARGEQAGDADRNVDEEHPAPRRLHEQAADDRTERGGERADRGPGSHRAHAPLGCGRGEQQTEAGRRQRGRTDGLQAAERDELTTGSG